jgi:putative transcriptional regulator
MSAEPRFHLPDEGIFAYAAGVSSEAAGLASACHLTFCARCRAEAAACDEVASYLLESLPGAPVDPALLDRVLAQLDPPPPAPPPPQRVALPGLATLPEPLQPYLARAKTRWRLLVPGVRAIDLPVTGAGTTARLIRFRPGFVIPLHDHAGPEFTVILAGALEDTGEVAHVGDVVYREPGRRHVQTITDDAECIAVVVNEGPLVPLTIKGRLLRFITGV